MVPKGDEAIFFGKRQITLHYSGFTSYNPQQKHVFLLKNIEMLVSTVETKLKRKVKLSCYSIDDFNCAHKSIFC